MRVEKIVDYNRMWVGKDGKEHPTITYYLVADVATSSDGAAKEVRLAIRPKFDKSPRDAYNLDLVSATIVKKQSEAA